MSVGSAFTISSKKWMSTIFSQVGGEWYVKVFLRAVLTWPKFSLTSFLMVSDLLRQHIVPSTIIDVGANVGQFSVASAKLFPGVCIHAFEPNPNSVTALSKNVRYLNNVLTYPLALGERIGMTEFHVNQHSQSSSILPLEYMHMEAFPSAREAATISVELSTLDKVFEDIELPAPALLKLDVQGYEGKVLSGAKKTLKRMDYVLLEASFKPMYMGEMLFMDVIRIMMECGFVFLRPVCFLRDPRTNEIIQMDALFRRCENN